MENYKKIKISNLDTTNVDMLYKELLDKKYQFMILEFQRKKYVLTKEKSLLEINQEEVFLKQVKEDIYYTTTIQTNPININQQDLALYQFYIKKFKEKLSRTKYYDKYYFGCVAVKTDKGMITTIRGKENLEEYTIIEKVDHEKHKIYANQKKATLNAPLMDYLLKNKQVKAIVHLHEFDHQLPYDEYAFPGTVKDSIRKNTTSFNIRYHGVIYLFDEKGNML